MQLTKLYKRTSTGKIQEWTMNVEGDQFWTTMGQVGGKLRDAKPTTAKPKNAGNSNATTGEEQAMLEAQAKWKKKSESGYTIDINEIDNVSFRKPMKGELYRNFADKVVFPVVVQDKLNGVRAQSEKPRTYSTGGKTFHTVPHIREDLRHLFEDHPNALIDGEFFNFELRQHLNRLIKLVSVIIQPKHLTPELLADSKEIVQLHVFDGYGFDGITKETPYIERHAAVKELFTRYNLEYTHLLPYGMAVDDADLSARMVTNFGIGGEGLIVRYGDCPHKDGKSQFMLKLKHADDDEFEIVDIQEGKGNWAGCAKRIIIKLHTPATNATKDETCASNIMGGMEYLRDLLQNKEKHIGKMATVQYQHFSEYGIPQLPFVAAIRDYE